MHHGILAILLALSACASPSAGEDVRKGAIGCEFQGPGPADLICDLFLKAVERSDRTDISHISVRKVSPTQARAIAIDVQGHEAARLDFDVIDAEMDSAKWDHFAEAFQLHLAATL